MSVHESTDSRHNAAKLADLVANGGPMGRTHTDLYRTAMAGPDGQTTQVYIGTVRYVPYSPHGEYVIADSDGKIAGWAIRVIRAGCPWFSVAVDTGPIRTPELIGWVSTLAMAADLLLVGPYAPAPTQYDALLRSGGSFQPCRLRTSEGSIHRRIMSVLDQLADDDLNQTQRAYLARDLALCTQKLIAEETDR